MKSYSELITLPSFEERFNYLLIGQEVGLETFGHDRYLNQKFYRSPEWRLFRRDIILRDNGCEFGLEDFPINDLIIVHHINPILPEDVVHNLSVLMDPENAVCTSSRLHQAVHYGNLTVLEPIFYTRQKGDTVLW